MPGTKWLYGVAGLMTGRWGLPGLEAAKGSASVRHPGPKVRIGFPLLVNNYFVPFPTAGRVGLTGTRSEGGREGKRERGIYSVGD